MVEEIDRLRKQNESLGGKFEIRSFGLVPGIGSHVSWSEKLDGRLAQAICSIQSVKGVSLGEAWRSPAGRAPRRTTRSSGPRTVAGTARRIAPAASKAA